MWHESIVDVIGSTPMVRLNSVVDDAPCTVVAKLEFFNPGASVKDRIGVAMIEAAEAAGDLNPGGTIIEGTSGNTGAALAIAAVARGYRCIFTTTDKQSQEKLDVLRALGAEVIVCPTNVAPDDPKSYYSVARRLAGEIPNSVYLNQYDHPANAKAHYETTGPEVWVQTEGRITHFFAGAGTGGTISGSARYLKEQNPDVKIVGVDPYGSVYYKYFHSGDFDKNEIYPYVTEGVGEDILAQNMDFEAIDDYVRITDRESMQMTRRLAREEGLFCGQSSGMAVAGVKQWMDAHVDELDSDDVAVVLLPDSGFRYLSKTFNDNWMRNHGFLESKPDLTVSQVLTARRMGGNILAASPDDTLGEVIKMMAEQGISQMPVLENDRVVGSLTESVILNRLIETPDARDEQVREVMGKPFPVVPRSLHLEHLSAYLEQGAGAVLVEPDDGKTFQIITKSDLISALAMAGLGHKKGQNGKRE